MEIDIFSMRCSNKIAPDTTVKHTEKYGTKIGNYLIQHLIGSGGFCSVYAAIEAQSLKAVCIKIARKSKIELGEWEDYTEDCTREFYIAKMIESPQVVKMIYFGFHQGLPYLVMERAAGSTLLQYLASSGSLGAGRVKNILANLITAYQVIAVSRVVHCDLKPQNIIIDKTDQVKVIDFGSAKIAGSVLNKKNTTATLGYSAPELFYERSSIDHRADQFSIGIIAIELLQSKFPFSNESRESYLKNVKCGLPFHALKRLPSEWIPFIVRLVQFNACDRFESPDKCQVELQKLPT